MGRIFSFIFMALPLLTYGQGFITSLGAPTTDQSFKVFQVPNKDEYIVLLDDNDLDFVKVARIDRWGNLLWKKSLDANTPNIYSKLAVKLEADGFRLGFGDGDADDLVLMNLSYNGDLLSSNTQAVDFSVSMKLARFASDALIGVAWDSDISKSVVYKLDLNGNLVWKKVLSAGQLNSLSCRDILVNSVGDILVLVDGAVTKLDANGNFLWKTSFSSDSFSRLHPFPDGTSYLIVNQNYIRRIDNDGQLLWNNYFGDYATFLHGDGVLPGEGNSLYLTYVHGTPSLDDFMLAKLSDAGNLVWEKKLGDHPELNLAGPLFRDSDGNFIVTTASFVLVGTSNISDLFAFKADANGNLIWKWHNTFPNHYGSTSSAVTTSGDCLLLSRVENPVPAPDDNILIKIDANGVVYGNQVRGSVVFDQNSSCSREGNEPLLKGWLVKALGAQATYASTDNDGRFLLPTNSDTVALVALSPNACWGACADPIMAIFPAGIDTVEAELYPQATKNCPVLELSTSTPFLRRCFSNHYAIQCENTGTEGASNAQVEVELDPFFSLTNSSVPVATVNGSMYRFDLGNLGVGEKKTLFLTVDLSCSAELGQVHCLLAHATADNTCPTGVDNSLSQNNDCQPNIGSFDPNDKRAFSEGRLVERFIAADSLIEYQVRFQNTGTDTAFNVVITDTLSSLLDIESLRPGASSHAYRVELEQSNIVKFLFDDILLPDSNVNEPGSHGFIKFQFRHKPGLVPGDVVPNRAAIYFDFNEPIITNNLELEIKSPISQAHAQPVPQPLLVYPQPSTGAVYFERTAKDGLPCRLQLVNLLGQVAYDQPMLGMRQRVEGLPTGQYFYRLRQNGAVVATGKVVVFDPR